MSGHNDLGSPCPQDVDLFAFSAIGPKAKCQNRQADIKGFFAVFRAFFDEKWVKMFEKRYFLCDFGAPSFLAQKQGVKSQVVKSENSKNFSESSKSEIRLRRGRLAGEGSIYRMKAV